MKPSGGTATGDALATSLEMVRTAGSKAPGAIVLLSDGKATHGRDPLPVADEAKRLEASRSTPSRSAPPPARCPTATPCRRTRRRCERSPSARAAARSPPTEADALSAVYEKLGSEVATKKEKREVTAGFAGGAAILLLLGGGLSLRWFRRLL